MAIAFDASEGVAFSNATTTTLSHTCTGSNLVLFVAVGSNVATFSAFTYNGVNATGTALVVSGGSGLIVGWWVAPATGAHNISITTATTTGTMSAVSFTGVDQTNPIVDVFSSTNTLVTFVETLTPTIAHNAIVALYSNSVVVTPTITAPYVQGNNTTQALTRTTGNAYALDAAPAGQATSLGLTGGSNMLWNGYMVSLRPVGEPTLSPLLDPPKLRPHPFQPGIAR